MNTSLKTYLVVMAGVVIVAVGLVILYTNAGPQAAPIRADAADSSARSSTAPAKDPPTAATPRPLPAKAPVAKAPAGPQDHVKQAEEYAPEIEVAGKALVEKWKINANGELEPAVAFTLTNRGPRNVNHFKMICQLDGGILYQDTQVVAPLAGPNSGRKVLARSGGTFDFTVQFKKAVINEAAQAALKARGAKWAYEVIEVGFAD
jgi:hypothetical protein